MSIKEGTITKLEYLPNEILLEILEYLTPCDIFQSFYFLNKRYNHFLLSQYFRIDLIHIVKKNFDYYNYFLFSLIRERISSLRCEDLFDRLIYQIHLSNFHALKYLTISKINLENLQYIIPQLNFLPKLIYLNLQGQSKRISIHQIIFKGQLPSIEKCILNFNTQLILHHGYHYPNLQHLTINHCTIEDLLSLLHTHTPQLQHLIVTLIEGNILIKIDPIHHLKSLIITTHTIPFQRLVNSLFPLFPYLQRLSMTATGIDYTDGKQWASLLSTYFLHLIHFQLHITFPQENVPTPNDRLPLLKSFEISYFRSHQWYFTILHCPSTTNLILFSFPMIDHPLYLDLYHTEIETTRLDHTLFAHTHQLSLVLTNSNEPLTFFLPKIQHLKLISQFQEYQSYPKNLFVHISHLLQFSRLKSIEFHGSHFPSTSLVLLDYTPRLHSLIIPLNSLIKMTKTLMDEEICERLKTLIKHLTITSIESVKNFLLFERLPIVFTHLDSLSLFLQNPNDLYIIIIFLLPKLSLISKTMNITIEILCNYHLLDQFMLWLIDYLHTRDFDHVEVKLSDYQFDFSF